MKKHLSTLFGTVLIAALVSCGNNKSSTEQPPSDSTASSSDLMKEAPAYDKTKIDPSAPVVQITLSTTGNTMTEMKYDQEEITVKEGSTVRLTLVNKAKDEAMQHNFVLIEEGSMDKVGMAAVKAGPDKKYIPDLKEVYVATNLAGPGQESEAITFPAPPKGVYDFICSYPGHYKTMNGKFIVN